MLCCGTIQEGPGKIGDFYMRPVDEAADSYIQDSTDLLRKIQKANEKGPQPKGMWLFSLDVKAMYPSIPTNRGPGWVAERLREYGLREELVEWLEELLNVLLTTNRFVYDEKTYSQETGTAIGSLMACSYSGIVMAIIEEEGLKN